VLVLMTGSALSIEWAHEHLPAILVAWYPGQRGGNAIADVLFGDTNPGGRLPVTFYRSVQQLPPFADYDMKGRTYRYFTGEPLYAFGYGLSYTRFDYSDLQTTTSSLGANDAFEVSVAVKNVGERAGDEVVQLYVRSVSPSRPMPIEQLRGFARVTLQPGERKRVTFRLRPVDDFAYYDETRKAFAVEPGLYELGVGASSRDIRQRAQVRVP
jgi:beta-glucosidase